MVHRHIMAWSWSHARMFQHTHTQIHHSSLSHLRVSSISITRKRLWKAGSVRAPATKIGIVDSQRSVQRVQWMCFIFTKPILGCHKAGIVTLTNYPSSDVTMRSLWFTLKSVGSLQLPKSPNHTSTVDRGLPESPVWLFTGPSKGDQTEASGLNPTRTATPSIKSSKVSCPLPSLSMRSKTWNRFCILSIQVQMKPHDMSIDTFYVKMCAGYWTWIYCNCR